MYWSRLLLLLVVTAAAGKGKKHRHHKPGRALLDRLSSDTVSEVTLRRDAGLLPAPLDVAPYSTVTANATCGEADTEEFCRETPGKHGVVCDVCEGLNGSPSRRHPPSHASDGDPTTWWQSPTLATGEHYRHVDLIATLPDEMELLHVIIKSGPSPRPLAWSLEVSPSEESDEWRLIRAFGDREHCRRLWDLRPERRRRKARGAKRSNRSDKPTCSTQFTSPRPLENGEMHVGVGEGVIARRVRISLRATHAAPNARRYYTIRALTLAARCLCHGQASLCHVNAQGAICECVQGSCGAHCEKCCSGVPWSAQALCPELVAGAHCSCGERGACSFDDSGAVLCVNCSDNRAGPLCDRCLTGYYSGTSDGPCLPCNCDLLGSDGTCEWDRRHHQVSCRCRPGFTGFLCDGCDELTVKYPHCGKAVTPVCKCDPRGIIETSSICSNVCECKANVVGELCDACKPGHFGLSAALAGGCRPCYCSHLTESCSADPNPSDNVVFPLDDAWVVTDGNETLEASVDEQGKPYLISYEVEGWETFYWLSSAYSGERLSAYGGELQASLVWAVVRGDTGGNPTHGPDFILIASDGTRLTNGNTSHEVPGPVKIAVPVTEGNWYIVSDGETELATRHQLMDVLRDLHAVMIRAHFHMDQDEVRIEGVELRGAAGNVREICACPPGYAGPQCARCAWTHARVQHAARATPGFECVPCACNGHAHCDTVDGPCGPCQHNTTGPHCERCLPGHYGNPVQGACKPCACPLYAPSNNFSPNCVLAGADGDDYVCTQCPEGYTGDHCESCEFGYYGSPEEEGSACRPCKCDGAPCDRRTGLCFTCPQHTEGARCEQCQEGYWFGPDSDGNNSVSKSGCVACACGAGSLAAACDARSGQCACKQGWTGRACDVCASGYGGVSAGCPACGCGVGARGAECDAETGMCECSLGTAPPHCDVCLGDHYGITSDGCQGCNCSAVGSEGNACDIRTGQCRCKPHITGRACDTCEEGYWGLQHGGCRQCECGAGAAACDPVSGECACAPGVTGRQCDRCLQGYYGFSPTGCLPCPVCKDGKVCSPDSGRCVCPGRSRGPGCRLCAPGYWAAADGCQPCKCGPGAIADRCEPHSGECKCRIGWSGPRCDVCAPGYFGERCRPCLCSVAGTRDCDNDNCTCDARGNCPCKENVEGAKCDRCVEGTFGLSATSPTGCTACFCFGRSAHCTQAGATRAAVHAPAPLHLTLARSDLIPPMQMDQNSLLSIHTHSPDATISVPWPPVPVYVELDDRFTGDKVTSYGGLIKFKVEVEGGEQLPADTLANFPLVRLYSKQIVLDYFQRVPPVNGTHLVRLHESLWSVRTSHGSEARASRGALMLVLQQLQQIVLRITTRAPTHQDNVHALLLNVSLDTAIPGLSRSEPALGVEVCACGSRYAAWSCQLPALGYWLPTPRVHQTLAAGTIVISLEGDAQPCQCNGRATACDPVTGHCLNCTDGTGGPQCERCAEGQYGAPPPMGDGCTPCPCPSRARNFATSCELSDGLLQCLCKPGYSGAECAQCASGYRRTADGACASCACSPGGAASPACDAHGRCHCRPHAAGDRCDRCQDPRALLDDDGCTPCDNCTQTLLDSVEELTANLVSRADITELSRIPHPFPAVREFAANASTLQVSLNHLKKDIQLARRAEASLGDIEAKEHIIFTEANTLKTDSNRRQMEAHSLALESMSGLEEVLKTRRKLGEEVEALNEFARGEKHLSAHRALKEARHLLRAIKEIKLMDFLAGANDVFDTAYVQSTAVDEYKYRIDDLGRRVRTLHSALERWESKAEDINNLTDSVWSAGDAIGAQQKSARPRLAAVKDVGLRCRLLYEDIIALAANNLTDDAASLILSTRTLAINFPPLIAELEALALAAEEKEGILYNLTPNYRKKYLQAVEKHVALLSDKAKEYKRLFAGTRALAASGVSAATAWAEVAENVHAASDLANAALSAASAAGKLAAGPAPLLTAASNAKEASRQLKARGAAVLNKAEELRVSVEQVRRGGDVVSVSLRALGWAERALNARPSAHVSATLAAASERADRVFATTRALYDEASELGHRIRYALRPQLADLQRHGDSALGAVQEHVSQIRSNTVRGAEVSEALEAAASARAREHSAAAANLSPRLAALRDAVARARDAADSISVSLASPWDGDDGAGCSRSYRVRTTSAVTRLTLAVTFDALVADGTLLYMRDDQQESKSFLKLSVEDKKLQLWWQLGAGVGMILHPENLQAAHDETDHTSYRIDIERIWNTVHMTVERAGSTPLTTSNSSAGELTGLRASRLWVGGAEGRGGLPACLHALYCDDIKIGLWNFADQPAQARCTGCTQRWYSHGRSGGAEPTMASFNGEGYAELRRSGRRPSDRRQFSLAFTFRTRDEDALLFMAVDAANNRSVTVRMRRCRVELSVQYADARLRIAASGRHCHGRPVHVQAIRVFAANRLERGSLRVNGEETLGSPSPPVQLAAELPDLSTATYWVGGVPPGAQGPAPPLLGCIGALTVDREGYDLLDTSKRHGVEARCGTRTLRSVMLQESGYVELPSPIIRRKADVGLTFLARSSSGLLLFRAPSALLGNDLDDEDPDDKHYLAINMVEGELEVIGMAGRGEARARTNGTRFDDQRSHTLRLRRAHKQLDLWVDERKVVSVPMAGSALPARSRGLYVGGLPAELNQQPPASLNLTGFTGTIADIIIDGTLLGMETGVRWEHAQLGRRESDAESSRGDSSPRLAPHASHALHARPSPPAGCTRTPSYTVEGGAVKFGDAAWSHASLRLPPTCRDLAVALQFRTFTPDGLLLLVPGSKSKPKQYLALVVRDGKLKLIVRGRKRREVALPDVVNDGTWRSVSVRASRSRVVVSSGGAAARAHAPPLTRSPRAARLYVGGVPPPPALPHLPKALLRGSGSGSGGGFRGCVRRVAVCGRAEDLVREADAHHRVRQCFPNVEKGAYFGGDAYAVWSNLWPPAGEASRARDDGGAASEAGGTSVVLRLQFRTYEPNGVLIAAHGLLLELREGLVVLTRQWSGGAVRAEARGAGGRAVCDGGWHAVEARGARAGGVALSLDGAPAHRVPPPALLEDPSPAPPAPLYIGGLPEGTVELSGEEGRENFKGCLREVTVDEQYKDWLAMDSVRNVLLDSCPVQ